MFTYIYERANMSVKIHLTGSQNQFLVGTNIFEVPY